MHLHRRQANCLQRVQNRNARMRIRRRVNHNSLCAVKICLLDTVYQIPLMVGLVNFPLHALFGKGFLQKCLQILVGLGTVNIFFPNPKHIDIRAVDYQNFHTLTPRNSSLRRTGFLPPAQYPSAPSWSQERKQSHPNRNRNGTRNPSPESGGFPACTG